MPIVALISISVIHSPVNIGTKLFGICLLLGSYTSMPVPSSCNGHNNTGAYYYTGNLIINDLINNLICY